MNRITIRILSGFFFFVVLVSFIQVLRNRSFWLDEAALMDNLIQRNSSSLLFHGSLAHSQQFPKVYLILIDLLVRSFGYTPFWARVLPLCFGLAAVAVWLWLFWERYGSERRQWMPLIVAAGMLVVSADVLRYTYEFKQYSAELFFCGALLALYQTRLLSEKRRFVLIVWIVLLSLLFSYSALVVLAVICGLMALEWKVWVYDPKERYFAIVSGIAGSLLLVFLYSVDYKYGFHGSGLHEYWAPLFVSGNTFTGKVISLYKLHWHFMFDWWRTEWGPMCERLAPKGAWYVLPLRTFRNPDIKNVLYVLVTAVSVSSLWNWRRLIRDRDVLGPTVLVVIAMAVLAWMHIYPWGESRLTLYAMPLVIILMIEGMLLACRVFIKVLHQPVVCYLFWLPLIWLVFRNGVFMAGAFTTAKMPEDIDPAMRLLNPNQSHYLAVPPLADLVLRTYASRPKEIQFLYETETPIERMRDIVGKEPLYFIWVHGAPALTSAGIPAAYDHFYRTADVLYCADRDYGATLLLLRP
jgi:hypothetical protein